VLFLYSDNKAGIFKKRGKLRWSMTNSKAKESKYIPNAVPPRRASPWDKYINKYISIYPQGINTIFAGKLIRMDENYGVLNPFQSGEYDENGKVVKKIYNREATVPLIGAAIEPTTRKSLENACKFIKQKREEPAKKDSTKQ
jgi:hypothetical protein